MKASPFVLPVEHIVHDRGRCDGAVAAPVVNRFVDRMLRLQREDRIWHRGQAELGLNRFPQIASSDRKAILRGLALHDAFNRLTFRFHTQFPDAAVSLARFVPVTGARRAFADVPKNRPIVLALMHFGPIHYVFTVLLPLLSGRNVYAMHAGGDTGLETARYLRRIGVVPILNDQKALLKLARIMADDPTCAVVFGFDHMSGRERRGRGPIEFLGETISVPQSLAFLADKGDAVVIAAWGEGMLRRPRVAVAGPFQIDGKLERNARQSSLTEQLFDLLAKCIRANPGAWTEWENLAG